jgi:NADPH2:quinone reductase
MKAVYIEEFGGPEKMQYGDIAQPDPGAEDVVVQVEAAGVNFIDIYQRTGLYPVDLPYTLGLEAAGTVSATGAGVKDFKQGDRVAFTGVAGCYADYVTAPVNRLVKLPDNVASEQAAAVMLQGMTAYYLARRTCKLTSGDRCLIHAAAGGVGLLLIQIAKRSGAVVYGTVSTEEKAELARQAGADEVIIYTREDFESRIQELTGGQGVHVVYDSVGKSTFEKSLNCLAPLGYMVLFGQSSGPVPPFDPAVLNQKGSLFLTRPSLFHYVSNREDLNQIAGKVLKWVASGDLDLRIAHVYPLSDAHRAHIALQGRKTTGKVLLMTK